MLLVAGGAALEMRAEARERRVGVGAVHLQLVLAVEELEARLAADLRADRTERARDRAALRVEVAHEPSSLCSPTE